MFSSLNIMVVIVSVITISLFSFFVFAILKVMMEWSNSAANPRVCIKARVLELRHISDRKAVKAIRFKIKAATRYYATFELDTGEKKEIIVPAKAFVLMSRGDEGSLSFQGEHFISFIRRARRHINTDMGKDYAFDDEPAPFKRKEEDDKYTDKYRDKYDERFYK